MAPRGVVVFGWSKSPRGKIVETCGAYHSLSIQLEPLEILNENVWEDRSDSAYNHDEERGLCATTKNNQRGCVVGYNVAIPVAKDTVGYKVLRTRAKRYGTLKQNVFILQNITWRFWRCQLKERKIWPQHWWLLRSSIQVLTHLEGRPLSYLPWLMSTYSAALMSSALESGTIPT